MIRLREDCLWLKGEDGVVIPCSVEQITLEIIGGGQGLLDPEVLRHAAAAVLHYFKVEMSRETVTSPSSPCRDPTFWSGITEARRSLFIHCPDPPLRSCVNSHPPRNPMVSP